MSTSKYRWLYAMSFSARLIALRHERNLTQQALANATDIHVQQIKRYEAGTSQPSADAIKKLAQAFSVTTDWLLFESNERDPDEDLRLQFEAVSRMPLDDKKIVKALLDGMIFKYQTKQLVSGLSS